MPVSFASGEHNRRNEALRSSPGSGHISPALTRVQTSFSATTADDNRSPFPEMATVEPTERSALLTPGSGRRYKSYGYGSPSLTASKDISRVNSLSNSLHAQRYQTRIPSRRSEIASPVFTRSGLRTPKLHRAPNGDHIMSSNRIWYDQFTSTDWVHDGIADGYRKLELRKRKDFRGRVRLLYDAAQGWILVALIGCLTAAVAYVIDVTESAIFDLKRGYCKQGWFVDQATCCGSKGDCDNWLTWSEILHPLQPDNRAGDFLGFVIGCVFFATIAMLLTMMSKRVIPLQIASTFDENLGAVSRKDYESTQDVRAQATSTSAMTYYSAAGSGVAEVKVILSGFVLHGYLGLKTLFLKCLALIFSVASGMSVGKEGPYVHIAACIGNVACRLFPKYRLNDGKRREVLSAAAAGGVAVAFGSPLGGVLFSLEEVSYYFSPKTLFRTFFCCIAAALSLKFLNPYGTNKIVIFEVRYVTDWHWYELFNFAVLGVAGGLAGAGFIKASRFWATTFRRVKFVKSNPWFEVILVAVITGVVSFWNKYTKLAVTELLFEIARPCEPDVRTGLCPQSKDDIPEIIGQLLIAFVIKAILTIITFGIKVPAGIYVPSMVCGGLMGRIVGHAIQYAMLGLTGSTVFDHCAASGNMEHCVTPGVYALVAAGATMCGVTRLSVTLAVILFELTGSLDYVLPFAIGVLLAKWTADFVEPSSIYDLLIDMNSYPFMDNKHDPIFNTEVDLGDITPRFPGRRTIDISISPYVRASELRVKLKMLQDSGELDGGLAITCDKALVGLIPAPDLEFALDRIETPEDETLCLMSYTDRFGHASSHKRWFAVMEDESDEEELVDSSSGSISINPHDPESGPPEVDLVPFVDPAPMALEAHSPMNLVYQCFSKLGLRYICVVEAGKFRGMVHKKLFVKYLKTCETESK